MRKSRLRRFRNLLRVAQPLNDRARQFEALGERGSQNVLVTSWHPPCHTADSFFLIAHGAFARGAFPCPLAAESPLRHRHPIPVSLSSWDRLWPSQEDSAPHSSLLPRTRCCCVFYSPRLWSPRGQRWATFSSLAIGLRTEPGSREVSRSIWGWINEWASERMNGWVNELSSFPLWASVSESTKGEEQSLTTPPPPPTVSQNKIHFFLIIRIIHIH